MPIKNDQISKLRRDYNKRSLDLAETHDNPIEQFKIWLNDAVQKKVLEPNAMVLATVGADGMPSARVLLLKGVDEQGFIFYTNYQSRKAEHMANNPKAAMVFAWLEVERQVRIEGKIVKVDARVSDAYFQSRPRGSRIGAWVSPQSQDIPTRDILEKRVGELTSEFEHQENIPRPPFWGGYQLVPTHIEFWQGRSSRLHDRILYTLEGTGWKRKRLAP